VSSTAEEGVFTSLARGRGKEKSAKQQALSCTPKDHKIQDGAPCQGHAPGAGEREPLRIIVRSTDGIAFTLQDVTHTLSQVCIPIEQQYPRHGRLLCTWTRHRQKDKSNKDSLLLF